MYKDPRGNYISENSVVLLGKHFYTVTGFDSTKNCPILLRNGFIASQAAPDVVICVDGLRDLESICKD